MTNFLLMMILLVLCLIGMDISDMAHKAEIISNYRHNLNDLAYLISFFAAAFFMHKSKD